MKKVTIKGKLCLNKIAVSRLDISNMKEVGGGKTKVYNCAVGTHAIKCATNSGCHTTNRVICFP